MDDNEIKELERLLDKLPVDDGFQNVDSTLTIADFCLDSVKEMMGDEQRSLVKNFHVLHAGSLYYIDMVVRAIAPPYESRPQDEDGRQWFGQRPT